MTQFYSYVGESARTRQCRHRWLTTFDHIQTAGAKRDECEHCGLVRWTHGKQPPQGEGADKLLSKKGASE